jgi:DNA-binding transcriptional MerR regulator
VGTYSIKDLEQLSGIKAHTLRVWEQRYGIVQPKRTPTKIRYYNDGDLRLVLNISFLNRNNYKISKIAKMSEGEISDLVVQITSSNLEFPNQVNAMVISMVNLDEERFEKIISTNTLQFGFEKTMTNIVYPFLQRIGILWQTGNINPAHEHFISNLIRQKLIVAIDGQIAPQNPRAKKFVLFLPEGELHELSLLFAVYLIKSRHNKAIYLGQSLPMEDLETVHEVYKPDYFYTTITSAPNQDEFVPYVETLHSKYPDTQLLLSGYLAIQNKDLLPEGVAVMESIDSLVDFLDKNSEKPFE